jgi:hypothetical protein
MGALLGPGCGQGSSLALAAGSGALDVPQVEVAEDMAMEALNMPARAGEPSLDGGFDVTKDAHGGSDVEPLGQG